MMLAMVAALAVGVAQALTVSWENVTQSGYGETITSVDFTKDITVKLTYAVTSDALSGSRPGYNFFMMGWGGRTDNNVSYRSLFVRNNGNGLVINSSGSSYRTTKISDLFAVGDHTFAFAVNLTDKTGSYVLDGTEGTIAFPSDALGFGSDLYIATGPLVENGITLKRMEFTATVPEPTVLALLALGVAGLALRRKVA